MSTSEYRSVDAESELPISATELAALATQLYAASIRPGPDSPPQAAPVAPRGNVPDTTAAASAGQTAAGNLIRSESGSLHWSDRCLCPGTDIAGARGATAGGARGSAWQCARYDGGALCCLDGGRVWRIPSCCPASRT